MRRLRYSVPYIAGKNLPKDSDPAPRGAGQSCGTGRPNWPNFNPPAPCGAGLQETVRMLTRLTFQSTRPLRGGTLFCLADLRLGKISIRPPLAGRDRIDGRDAHDRHISIHPPLAGRDGASYGSPWRGRISIHPPLAGRDLWARLQSPLETDFNPPAPCGAGLRGGRAGAPRGKISIHPPLAGRDPHMQLGPNRE